MTFDIPPPNAATVLLILTVAVGFHLARLVFYLWKRFGPRDELVIYAIVSREVIKLMKGNRGKLVNQGGHATLHAWWDAQLRFPAVADRYRYSQAAVKVTLVVDTTQELKDLYELFRKDYGTELVEDSGRTLFDGVPTITYVGVGPITKAEFEKRAGRRIDPLL